MSQRKSVISKSAEDFEGWVREHQAGLRAFVRALGVDEAWVDDIAQETFVVAYHRLEHFEPGTDFGKWLRSIARNLAANERRKEARRSRLLPAAIADLLLSDNGSEEVLEADFGRLLPVMRECVQQLPPRNQELLRRRYAEGENAMTLSRELGMKAATVRQSLLRIRVLVKDCIEKKIGKAWL
jgi:RNA polymerase sigma-70 factor (ECF subfamily)